MGAAPANPPVAPPALPVFRLALTLVCVLAGALPAAAERVRLRGGGPAHTDCMLVTEVAGSSTGAHGRRMKCTDGDPTCDQDGRADGTCTFSVRICLDDPGLARCPSVVITEASVAERVPALAELAAAVHALPMPVAAPDTCTPQVTVPVGARERPTRLRMRASARTVGGPMDRDRVALVCQPALPAVSMALVQDTVFTPSCASISCHGAARAGGLDLRPGAAAGALIDVPASNDAARAAGLFRVVPGAPDASFLLHKLVGTLAPEEGAVMPRAGDPLPPARVALVRRWIAGLPTP